MSQGRHLNENRLKHIIIISQVMEEHCSASVNQRLRPWWYKTVVAASACPVATAVTDVKSISTEDVVLVGGMGGGVPVVADKQYCHQH